MIDKRWAFFDITTIFGGQSVAYIVFTQIDWILGAMVALLFIGLHVLIVQLRMTNKLYALACADMLEACSELVEVHQKKALKDANTDIMN